MERSSSLSSESHDKKKPNKQKTLSSPGLYPVKIILFLFRYVMLPFHHHNLAHSLTIGNLLLVQYFESSGGSLVSNINMSMGQDSCSPLRLYYDSSVFIRWELFEQLTELPRRYQYETLDSAIDFLRYTKTAAEPRVMILAIWVCVAALRNCLQNDGAAGLMYSKSESSY